MRILLLTEKDELLWVRLLNALAEHNARQYRARPRWPGLYASGARYHRRERDVLCRALAEEGVETCPAMPASEVWCDVLHLYATKLEDCDGLAAARAGELLARGARALSSKDEGWALAKKTGARRIHAEVALTTRLPAGESGGLYHCVVRYRLLVRGRWSRWFKDDPSARLGMNGGSDERRQGLVA